MFHYDPGFHLDRLVRLQITLHRWRRSILLYRGYNIAELASKRLHGVLLSPDEGRAANKAQGKSSVKDITNHTIGSRAAQPVLPRLPPRAHPMAVCCGVVRRLSPSITTRSTSTIAPAMIASYRLVAKMRPSPPWPTSTRSPPFIYPRNDLSYSANFLRMMSGAGRGIRDQSGLEKAVDRIPDAACRPRAECLDLDCRLPVPRAPPVRCNSPPASPRCGAQPRAPTRPVNMLTRSAASRNPGLPVPGEGQAGPHPPDGLRHRVYKNYDPRAKVIARPATRC